MTLNKAGFPGSVNDVQWAKLLDLLGNDATSGMNVDPADGDRTVSVSTGISNVGGILADLDETQNVGPMPPNGSSNPKINRIILRARWSDKSLSLTWREGTPGPSPQPPTLVRNPGVQWESRLAQVRLEPGHGAIMSGDITREKVPPTTNFYNIGSIAGAPDASEGALIYYTAAQSLRIGRPTGYVEIANAAQQYDFGVLSSVSFNATGAAIISHNLGWVPSVMIFTPHIAGGTGGGVSVFPSSISSPFTSTQATIVAKRISDGSAYASQSITRIGWVAYR